MRQRILAERLTRAKGEGPQRSLDLLDYEDVDASRKLNCRKYDGCLTEMAVVGCSSWVCPGDCPWYSASPRDEEIEWRSDEPTYAVDPTKSWAGEE